MRKIFLLISAVSLLLFCSLRLYVYLSRPTPPDELRERVGRLPELSLKDSDGNPYTIEMGRPVVLVYFNSTCDHCQRQLSAIRANIGLFAAAQVVLMSTQPMEEVTPFIRGLNFDNRSDVRVVQISHEELSEVFGTLGLPQIFVYSPEGRLAALFAGETDISGIAEFLK